MATLPIAPMTFPANLAGQTNGKLGPCVLGTIWAHGWGTLNMHAAAAEAWTALQLTCEQATGAKLTTSGPTDAYRTYERQLAAFNSRMVRDIRPGASLQLGPPPGCQAQHTRTFAGSLYWLRLGMAPVASPGLSNHGWGLAADTAIYVPNTAYPAKGITSDAKVWAWIQANVLSFGFSWELAVEPWHLRYVAGDNTPARVLQIRQFFAGQGGK